MKLAEMCNTATSYIGEIEIGRRFPSIKLIEKISKVLNIEPYQFFIREINSEWTELNEIIAFLTKLPGDVRLNIINQISAGFCKNDETSLCNESPVSI